MNVGLKDWLNREYFAIESNREYNCDQKVHHLIYATAGICGVVAMQPLPFADIFALTPIQCYMGYKIARVRGIQLSEQEASDALKQVFGAVGMGFLAQQAVIGLYKLGLPFFSGFMTFPLVAGMTVGIGKAMDLYFQMKKDGRSPSSKELQEEYERGKQERANVQKPAIPSSVELKRPNRERVGKALELLRQGLAPYVAQEFGRHYDDRALIEAQSILPRHDRLNRNLQIAESDVAPLMRLMLDSWNNVFDSTLGRGDRTLVHEVREWRDKWAHQVPFSSDDTERLLDSTHRLLVSMSAPQAEEVGRMKRELRREQEPCVIQ